MTHPRGVPTPYKVHVHPYPTRYHGGIWTRPVFELPYVQSPQAVFKPDDVVPAAYKRYPYKDTSKPMSYAGLGALQYDTEQGVFRAGGRGGGIFDGTLAGLGASLSTSIQSGVEAAAGGGGTVQSAVSSGVASGVAWLQYSDTTKQLQGMINAVLTKNGYTAIGADGKLGPATCAAGKLAASLDATFASTWANVSHACQSYGTAPRKAGGGGMPAGPTTAEAVMTPPPPPVSRKTLAFVVGGLAAAGFVYLYTKKRKR